MTETTLTPISNFLTYFPEFDRGRPIAGGQVYIGEPDFDPEVAANQKDVTLIQENGDTVAATQPVILSAGGVPTYNGSPARMQFTGNYSLKVLSAQGAQIYYIPNYEVVNQGINSLVPSSAAVAAGESVITVPTYVPNVNTSVYFLNSNVAVVGVDIEETDSTTLTLTSAVETDSTLYIYRFNSGTINTAAASNVSDSTRNQSAQETLDEVYNDLRVNAANFGALGVFGTDYTTELQDAIDHAESLATNASVSYGGATVIIPAGYFRCSGLIIPKGVNLQGEGRYRTTIALIGDNNTLISNASTTTQVAADQVTWASFKGMSWVPDDPATNLPTGNVILDATGFSRSVFEDVTIGWCGGCTGVQMTGATLAGSGGPAQWYNSLRHVFCERLASWPAGGTGMLLGDDDVANEQITSWSFLGGRLSGAGSGTLLNLQGGTGNQFYGTVFESGDVILGSAAGTRECNDNSFFGAYFEGSSNTITINTNCNNNSFFGEFITGFTVTDNGVDTQRHSAQQFRSKAGSAAANAWEVEIQNGATKRPTFRGTTLPGISLNNNTAAVDIVNGAATGSAGYLFRLFKDGVQFLRMGTSEALFQASKILMRDSTTFGIFSGSGTPEGSVTADVGSVFMRTNGGASTTFYVKESGTGNTGWVAK